MINVLINNVLGSRKIYYFGLPIVLFLIVPGFLINEFKGELPYIDTKLLIFISVSGLSISTLLLLLVDRLLVSDKYKNIYSTFIRTIFYFTLVTGLYVPVSINSGLVDPKSIPINIFNLSIAIIVTLLLLILSFSRLQKILLTGICTILILNIFIGVYGLASLNSMQNKSREFIEVSKKKNIFVISFDGIPGNIAIETIKNNYDLQNAFRDFIAFENAITSSPGTKASIYAELTGNQNFKNKAKTEKELIKTEPEILLTNYLDNNGFNVYTYGPYDSGFQDKEKIIGSNQLYSNNNLAAKIILIIKLYNYIFVRVGTKYVVLTVEKIYKVSQFYSWIAIVTELFANNNSTRLVSNAYQAYGPDWDLHMKLTKLDYDGYLKKINVSEAANVAHFMHFMHTHFPVDFDSECRLRSNDKQWYEAHQNRAGVENETRCALTQMSNFIKRLKELGIYDQSLIVLKSDHGKPVSYLDPKKIESSKIRWHQYWGYGRYTPLLLVKNFHTDKKIIKYDDNAVMLDDLAKTLCLHSAIDADCNKYPGFDLLDSNLNIPESADAFIFIVKNKGSGHDYDTHEALHLKRKKNFFKNLDAVLKENN